jgi:2-oxoglutarate ferredoxin oxidoreductase subunit alpha
MTRANVNKKTKKTEKTKKTKSPKELREFWQGNYAVAEGAIAGGCNFYAGYPITPSSEVFHHLSQRLPEVGGACLQMEDEIASIAAVIGASWAGAKAMTATSGPGFSLMQENIGYAIMTETPCVIVNVMRAGPSTGQATLTGAGDIYQARYGTHGADFETIALSPSTVSEAFTLTVESFNLAEQYRTPVILLMEEHIGHLLETVVVPTAPKTFNRKRPKNLDEPIFGIPNANRTSLVPPMPRVGDGFKLLVTGSTHNEFGWRQTKDGNVHRKLVHRLAHKILTNKKNIIKIQERRPKSATVGLISYGAASRVVNEAYYRLSKSDQQKVGNLRLISIWPFADEQIKVFAKGLKHLIVPEYNSGLLIKEIERFTSERTKLHSISQIGGGEPIRPNRILELLGECL